jgi:hypothetical protein
MQRGKYLNLVALTGALTLAAGMISPASADELPVSTALPAGWSEVNLTGGSGNITVSGAGATAVLTMNVNGDDIQGTADRGYFVYQSLPGDGGITARILSQTGGRPDGWMKTGVMLRENDTAGAAMATINQATGQSGTEYLFRLEQDGDASKQQGFTAGRDLVSGGVWMRAQRQGQNYQLLLSDDGKRWRLIKEMRLPIDASEPVLAGLGGSTAAGGDFLVGTATFDNVGVSADVVQPSPNGPVGLQAEPGNGKVLLTFLSVPNATGYNIYRRQVGQTPDQAVLANAVPTPYAWFIDDNAGAGLPNGASLTYIVRAVFGEGATAFESMDSAPVLSEPQVPIAPGFRSFDIGTMTPGSTTLDQNVLTITASGSDIGGQTDGFRFVAMARNEENYTLSAKLLEKPTQGTGNDQAVAKAGVMIRESLDPASRHAMVEGTAGQGVAFEWRKAYHSDKEQGNAQGTADAQTTYPQWLRITRTGDEITGFQSADGTNFTQIGQAVAVPGLSVNQFTYAGLAVTARKDGLYGTGKFDAASVTFQ